MDKMIVVVFDSEMKAYEGSRALQELADDGSINLYAKAVISNDASGRLAIKQQGDMGPVGTAVGLLTGSLVGMVGGPVGLAIGAGVGAYGGFVYDMANLGVGEDYLIEVEKSLKPGKSAVVADIWEEWTLPVDARMEELGGVVYRRMRYEFIDEQIEKDIESMKVELAELKAERDQATGEAREKLQKKVAEAESRLQSKLDIAMSRLENGKQETEAKILALQDQAARSRDERKAKLEAQIAERQAAQKRRNALLKQAWELTKEALSA